MKSCLVLLVVTVVVGFIQLPFCANNVLHVDSRTGVDNSSCLGAGSTPCLTLMYALLGVAAGRNSTIISIASGTYSLTDVVQLDNMEDFTVYGSGMETSVITCSKSRGGIYFTRSTGVSVSSIAFSKCGSAQGGNVFPLSFVMCTNVSLVSVRVSYSVNSAASFDSCGGLVIIQDCEFINNSINVTTYSKGGAVSVLLPNANETAVRIENCLFKGNVANLGGAIYVEMHQLSQVLIKNCILTQNVALLWRTEEEQMPFSGSGGAVSLYVVLYGVSLYAVTVTNTSFNNNTAVSGAGVHCLIRKRALLVMIERLLPVLSLMQCKFEGNIATTGAALVGSVVELDSVGFIPWILQTGNQFIGNTLKADGIYLGTGTVLLRNVNVEFNGNNSFLDNHGSALILSNGVITLGNNSNSHFIGNSGFNGGGLQLIGESFLRVNSNSSVEFLFNLADNRGGAIYHFTQGTFWNVPNNCFIQFVGEQNSTSFLFEGNQARNKTNAIYSNTISACKSGNDNISSSSFLFCRSNWLYLSSDCRTAVDSEVVEFMLSNLTSGFKLFSGVKTALPLTVTDLFGNNITEDVILSGTVDKAGAFTQPLSGLISSNEIEIYGKENSTGYLQLRTNHSPFVGATIPYALQPCPPGFLPSSQQSNVTIESTMCECVEDAFVEGSLVCSNETLTSDLVITHCISHSRENSSILVVGVCPFLFDSAQGSTIRLPKDPSDVEERVCGQMNRQGVLCGECKPGYSISVYSYSVACVKCESQSYGWLIYLLAQYLPIVLIFLLVAILNLTIISPASNAFLFYSQVTSVTNAYIYQAFVVKYAFGDTVGSVFVNSFNTIYGIWNMDFFRAFLPPICFHENFDILLIIFLDYIAAIFPLILVVLTYVLIVLYNRNFLPLVWVWKPFKYCLMKLHTRFESRVSLVNGFATFLVLSYLKILGVTFRFLQFVFVYDIHGTVLEIVYYYNGNLKMFQGFHLPFGILALITTFTVIVFPPVLLTCYQFKWFQKVLEKLHLRNQALVTFVEVIQSGLTDGRDGTKDRRFFAGFYFILRIALFGPTTVAPQVFAMVIVPVLTFSLGVMGIVIFQPYQNTFYNKLDVLFLMMLIISSFIFVLALFFALSGVPGQTISPLLYLSYFIGYGPLVYMIMYVVRWIVVNTKACKCPKGTHRSDHDFTVNQKQQRSPSLFSAPDRVLQPEIYQSLLIVSGEGDTSGDSSKDNGYRMNIKYNSVDLAGNLPPAVELSTYST